MKKGFLILAILALLILLQSQTTSKAAGTIDQCSTAVHDHLNYGKTTGPDGNKYATWMPQLDTASNCHHGHEHGTNPAQLSQNGWRPAYGVASTAANSAPMFHEGYKGVGWYSGDYIWYITIHQGSSEKGAVCARYHDIGVYVENYLTGERMAEIYYMGDFGYSRQNVGEVPLTPVDCPNQADVSGNGLRLFPTVSSGTVIYSPWRLARGQNAAGFNGDHLTVWVNSINVCDDLNCANWIPTGNDGAGRLVQMYGNMGFVNPPNTGEFCTDPYAAGVVDCNEPGAVHQYVNPSVVDLRPAIAGKCTQRTANDMLYVCGKNSWDRWAWSSYNILNGIGDSN